MTTFLFYGNFTPAYWRAIFTDAGAAPDDIVKAVAPLRCTIERFYFALEQQDFYAVLQGPSPEALIAARNILMAGGAFRRLHAEQLLNFSELFRQAKASSQQAHG